MCAKTWDSHHLNWPAPAHFLFFFFTTLEDFATKGCTYKISAWFPRLSSGCAQNSILYTFVSYIPLLNTHRDEHIWKMAPCSNKRFQLWGSSGFNSSFSTIIFCLNWNVPLSFFFLTLGTCAMLLSRFNRIFNWWNKAKISTIAHENPLSLCLVNIDSKPWLNIFLILLNC